MNNENTSMITLTGQGDTLLSRYSSPSAGKRERIMRNIISETTRPNGAEITLSSYEENGTVTYIVKNSHSHDTRFFGFFNSAVVCYNNIVEIANAEGEGK